MKRYTIIYFLLATIVFSNCTKNFSEINTDPTKIGQGDFDPNNLFTYGELGYGNMTEYQLYEFSCMTQQMASTFNFYGGGDKYDQYLTGYNDRFFTDGMNYAGQLLSAQTLAQQKDPVKYNNLIQMSRILWVMQMERISSIYGDIPYSQAGMAAQGISYPVYDQQSAIYPDMLSRLSDAISKLDASKPLPTGDMIYSGNIDKWKKLGYAIMIRIAMRLTKVDPATAQKYVEMAAGNTFSDVTDNAILKLDGTLNTLTTNNTANAIYLNDFQQIRWGKTFIDYLKANNDPRLYALSEKADTGLAYNNNIGHAGITYTSTMPKPVGMPNGYDLSGTYGISTEPNYPGATGTGTNASPLGNYARPVMAVFSRRNLPVFLITYAQTELLLAEASVRGWNVGSTALQHYQNGVQAALQSLPQWDASVMISADTITKFVSNLALSTNSDSAMNAINSQYWAASIFDFPESWSNWRRSGYPLLTPINYSLNITNGTIPRRLPYPTSENQNNPENYQVALKRMGGTDIPTTRVWWDK